MDWWLLSPEIIVATLALVLLILDFLLPAGVDRKKMGVFALIGLLAALLATLDIAGSKGQLFGGLLAVDNLSLFFKIIFILAAICVFLLAHDYLEKVPGHRGEFYWLTLTALLGMMITAASSELITIYIGIELMSLSFYPLVGCLKKNKASTEAALKYFILGSFAIAVWLYGAAILYGLTGTTDLAKIAAGLGKEAGPLMYFGLFLLLAGFGFKMGLVPFHMWVPDTYEGAPTPVTAYLAVGSKAAGFAVFLRLMFTAFPALYARWMVWLGILAVLTMTWGNIAALRQSNIKRLLAYSAIAHAGYTLIGVISFNATGAAAIMFYLFGYLFANLGAFAVVIAFANATGSEHIADYAGLRWRNPFLAFCLALCLLSLAGIPPLTGFFGKLYLFLGALERGGWLLTLVIIAAINSAISLFYYVNVIRTMYLLPPKDTGELKSSPLLNFTLVVTVAGVLLALFYFQPLIGALQANDLMSAAWLK
ncbi:MAG: NADH-quinone oxidoreductase subunit [Clostridia bacterium]|nr:NADH-quinone oxidoreductase subunit [Clostridia bacterium]